MSLISIKLKKMCDKAVNTHPSAIQFVAQCYKTQEMCDKAVNRYFFISVFERYKTQELCDKSCF